MNFTHDTLFYKEGLDAEGADYGNAGGSALLNGVLFAPG